MARDSLEAHNATHVVAQHALQAVCSQLPSCAFVSFAWVFCSVRANKVLEPADDKVRPSDVAQI